MPMRVLVAGWFSFEQMGASAGDLLALELACDWLRRAGRAFDVAYAPPFRGGVDWRTVKPGEYDRVLFVCGPFGNGRPLTEFLERFSRVPLTGLNLTMLQSLREWNPFDALWERDSPESARPDLCFLSERPRVPVVGVLRIDALPGYGQKDLRATADAAIGQLLDSREVAVVPIDTRLDSNTTGLRTAAEVESLIAKMDAVVTTRLHGMVLALKNGVPALAIDAVRGGHKILRQARAIGWPVVFPADRLTPDDLRAALDFCLTDRAKEQARACRERAQAVLNGVRNEFLTHFSPQ